MISIKGLTHGYDGKVILSSIDLSIKENGIYVIMGESGIGKTTLLNLIAGLITPNSGEINTYGKKISYMFQEARLLPWMSVIDNVNLVLGGGKSTREIAMAHLTDVGLGEDLDKYPSDLSGGMAGRVSFARTIAYDADIILLDEPFNGIDRANVMNMISIIKKHQSDKIIVVVTHSEEYAELLSDKKIQL